MNLSCKRAAGATLAMMLCAGTASAQVFLNEMFLNPPGSAADDVREYIEIHGTPFRKLDGYAVALLNGTLQKYYVLNSLAGTIPSPDPEVDEFFSLDGLSLGANGILVIGIGAASNYPNLLADTNFQRWNTIWNGGLDTPGRLSNDGSSTLMLIRRRPGVTQADPTNPLGLRWGKDVGIDYEYITPVDDFICTGVVAGTPCNSSLDCAGSPCVPGPVDQFGDGQIDRGNPDGNGGFTLDCIGKTTAGDETDDLEVVDEVSWEHERGWEYDTDDRRVDLASTSGKFPERKVHQLDDPNGLNPDAISRVDYRTKGPGWNPVAGATGQAAGNKNWQDTATEQWIRGESVGSAPFFYDNAANVDPDAVQPFNTHVPLWLNDGVGTNYNYTTGNTYEIMAGRVNPLAVPFIPGDANRDGVCNQQDIDKIASVFGDADWIFSNAFSTSTQGNESDPADQTKPWDVDGTGNNGIEPSDLQWALNFQGNNNGRIVGVRYDSTTPSTTGVNLNSNANVGVTVSAVHDPACGIPLNNLYVGDLFTITVSARVSSGANTNAGQQNGVMQFVHDVIISAGGVVKAVAVTPLGSFNTTRPAIQAFAGSAGDLGVASVNGYTTAFTEGLGSDSQLYSVTFQAVALGSANISIAADNLSRFVASTPGGVKVGRTNNFGNPATVVYPAPFAVTVTNECRSDFDRSGFTDTDDFDAFVNAFEAGDQCADFDLTGFVDTDDFDAFVIAFESGC